jgi:periplasmic protein TonB
MSFARFVFVILSSSLGACTHMGTEAEAPQTHTAGADTAAAAAEKKPAIPLARFTPAKEIGVYKTQVAARIAEGNAHVFSGELPPILKSIVVLDLTVERDGRPSRIHVSRSNGFKDLERVALESVRKAGALPAPTAAVLDGRSSVRYLETWLFRADGKFQLRSLVTQPQPGAERLASTKVATNAP